MNPQATPEEIQRSKEERILAIRLSIDALMKCHDLETKAGLMTETKYKSNMTEYHNQRIEIEILLGNLPKGKKSKPKFRNGLYV